MELLLVLAGRGSANAERRGAQQWGVVLSAKEWRVEAKAAELELECGVGAGAEGRGERGGDRSPGARGGAPERALVPGDIAGQRHALGIRIRIRSRILGRNLLTSCNLLIYGAPYAGSFVTSVSGPRSSPDPVRFCAQYASSTRHVSDSLSDLLRSKISPTSTPSPADVCVQSGAKFSA
jgi:hypothetical protein